MRSVRSPRQAPAAIRDISVRKAAATHLAQMEGRYHGLLEAAPDAMVVVNQAGDIVLLNVQAEKQFGDKRDELLGQRSPISSRKGLPNGWSPTICDRPKRRWRSRSAPGWS
jgi:PAS domain-containing protein